MIRYFQELDASATTQSFKQCLKETLWAMGEAIWYVEDDGG